jgi:hypothetical protein
MTSTDTELLEPCAAWHPANDRYMSVGDRLADIHEDDQSAADRALGKEVSQAVHQIERRIFDTLAGLKAKILAFMGTEMGIPADSSHGWSLVTDIMALGGEW